MIEVRRGRGDAAYLAVLLATGKYLDLTLRVSIWSSGLTLNHFLNLLCLADLLANRVFMFCSCSVTDNMPALVIASVKLLYVTP